MLPRKVYLSQLCKLCCRLDVMFLLQTVCDLCVTDLMWFVCYKLSVVYMCYRLDVVCVTDLVSWCGVLQTLNGVCVCVYYQLCNVYERVCM